MLNDSSLLNLAPLMKLSLSLVSVFFLPLSTWAQSPTELITQAIKANPELKFYEAEIAAAKAEKQSGAHLVSPNVSVEGGNKHVNGQGDAQVWQAEISQSFDFPGRIALRKAVADRDIALAELGLLQFKALLGNEIRAQAGDLALLKRKIDATKSVRVRLEELIDVLVQRDTGSISAKLERRILEATLLTSDRALTDATKAASEASTKLNMLAGRAPDAAIQLSDTFAALPPPPSLEALKTLAARSNFELQQKRVQLARQGLKIDLTKSERWGNITFGPYLAGEQSKNNEIEGGLRLSIPLPLWTKKNQANVAAEEARQLGAQAMLNAALRDLERELSIARANYTAELEALSHWRPETEKEFQDAAEEADHHYRLGAVPATTYIEMQRGYLDALDTLIESRRNAWRHRMEIERLTGLQYGGETVISAIIDFSLKNRLLVIIGSLILLGAGIVSALHLPIDAVPDITNTQVQINTPVPALAPEETEKLVTYTLELALSGIAGVQEFRSITKSGLSQVTLVFGDDVSIYRARQLVSERLEIVELPDGLKPEMSPITTGLGEIVYYSIDYREDSPQRKLDRKTQLMELHDLHEFVVKPFLRSTPGVAEINTTGGYERQLVIQPRPDALRDAGMTFGELATIIGDNVHNGGGGIIERGDSRVLIRGVSKVVSMEDIANLPVKFAAAAQPLKVKDLAEVVVGSDVRTGAAAENGEEAVLGTVMMLMGENSRVVSKRAEDKIKELEGRLPKDVVMRILYARSNVVDNTIATVRSNLFEGAVLVIVVLLVLLGNWRAALIVASAIPLAFLFALIGMTYGGVSGNLMSLGAVDFGLIIDGAVVMVENIVRVLGQKQHELGRPLTARERLIAVKEAADQVASPMFFGVLIITLVYIPILALSSVEGRMFHPMAITVMLALGGALVLALTLMPVLCSLLLRGRITEEDNVLIRWAKWIYSPLLRLAWNMRFILITLVLGMLAVTGGIFLSLQQEFVPTLNEGSWTAMVFQPASVSITSSLANCIKTQKYIRDKVPEITRTFARIGTSNVATDPMSPGEYDLYMFYKPQSEWRQESGHPVSRDRLAEIIRSELAVQIPEQSYQFAQPIEMRFNELMEGSRADLSVKIFGEEFDVMENIGQKVKAVLEGMAGTNEAEFETEGRVPTLEIRVNRDALLKFNVAATEVNSAIGIAMAGQTAGLLIEHDRRRDIVVRLPENLRNDVAVMKQLPVRTRDGGLIDLGKLAEFADVDQVDSIGREDGHRRVGINVDLSEGTDAERYVKDARAGIAEQITLPEGYTVDFGGQFKHLKEARIRLAIFGLLALVLIFVLIHATFRSVPQTLIIYTGIPLAITGGVVALWVRNMPFNISAAIGFIALSGVAVLNGVVLISCFNQLRNEDRDPEQAVTEGSLQRLRPVLMTALVASLGFGPMAMSIGPGAEVQRPLATVVIGGILSSTFLTLFLLPILYRWISRTERKGMSHS